MSKANGSEALVAEQLSKDRAVIELCRRSLVNHFVVRDMDAALAYMADDVEWLGPFSCQTASDKKTMEDILRPEYSIRLALADERWRARKRANTWIVSARYTLLVVSAGGERSMPFKQHATYVWAPTPDGPRIVHLHVSNATDANPLLPSLDPGQNAIEFLHEHFDAQDFLRLHRSCLVHRGRIASIEDHQALLDDGSSYPIAERRSREIKQSFELTL